MFKLKQLMQKVDGLVNNLRTLHTTLGNVIKTYDEIKTSLNNGKEGQ